MSGYLANLARRGAGLPPELAPRTPAEVPEMPEMLRADAAADDAPEAGLDLAAEVLSESTGRHRPSLPEPPLSPSPSQSPAERVLEPSPVTSSLSPHRQTGSGEEETLGAPLSRRPETSPEEEVRGGERRPAAPAPAVSGRSDEADSQALLGALPFPPVLPEGNPSSLLSSQTGGKLSEVRRDVEAPKAPEAAGLGKARASSPRDPSSPLPVGERAPSPRIPEPVLPALPGPEPWAAEPAEPRIEVRIGRVELRAAPPPVPSPAPLRERGGFEDYALARRYLRRRWY